MIRQLADQKGHVYPLRVPHSADRSSMFKLWTQTEYNNLKNYIRVKTNRYTIGVDFGSDSVRSLIVDVTNGMELSSAVFEYPRWKKGLFCDPVKNQFRQHPLDYVEGITATIKNALSKVSAEVALNVIGITIATTGSTPVAVDRAGLPLALKAEFESNPNAMFILWKDHTAIAEANEINTLAKQWDIDFTRYEGGIYSSEWFWAKIMHITRIDPKVKEAAWSWVEHCDWMPALLTGNTDPDKLIRNRCAAGHKAMWHDEYGGLPSQAFLEKLEPGLGGLRERYLSDTLTCDKKIGFLSKEWAKELGLNTNVVIGVGAFDAHMGAIGAEIKPYELTKVMGTSTCDILVVPANDLGNNIVDGICGQVDGSVLPALLGLEAGQSAFGDVYKWFQNLLLWPVEKTIGKSALIDEASKKEIIDEITRNTLNALSKAAEQLPIGETTLLALDWLNGRRTPDANQSVKGALTGITLGTDAPRLFKALVEATAFGSKAIAERFRRDGLRIDSVIALGGIAQKSSFVMQIVADVMNMPIKVVKSEQTCALGAAMSAAVAADFYPDLRIAQEKMGGGFEKIYNPVHDHVLIYEEVYQKYLRLGAWVEKQIDF